ALPLRRSHPLRPSPRRPHARGGADPRPRPDPPVQRRRDAGLGRRLPRARDSLAPLRTGREARGSGGLLPPLALQPRHHGRTGHRFQARNRGHGRGELLEADAGGGVVPGALARPHRPL
ncbi:MAG: Tryptophan 2,3-dioxygenase, partial [uncultured Rubellimicrobium sp.]